VNGHAIVDIFLTGLNDIVPKLENLIVGLYVHAS